MNARNKSQQVFVAVTMLTILAVTTVFMVYAVLLASYQGGNVTITTIGGSIQYSVTNTTGGSWQPTLSQGASAEWYARISISNSPSQDVTVTWTLHNVTSGLDVTTDCPTTTMTLTSGTTYIYASSNGLIDTNQNWGDHTTSEATYRIDAEINTA